LKHREEIFTLDIRRKIYIKISKYPGLHLRELSRILNMPKSTLVYHINYLLKRNIISVEKSSGYERFYISRKFNKKDKELINVIREKVPQNLILYFCLFPVTNQREIVSFAKRWENHWVKIPRNLKKHPTTLSFHLNKLVEHGLINRFDIGNEVVYFLNDLEDIIDLLIMYEKRLFGKDVKRVIYYMQHQKNVNNVTDKILNKIFDYFPHPYFG
jgi:predicted transcriptional regulator